jgi:hypothetical protein
MRFPLRSGNKRRCATIGHAARLQYSGVFVTLLSLCLALGTPPSSSMVAPPTKHAAFAPGERAEYDVYAVHQLEADI